VVRFGGASLARLFTIDLRSLALFRIAIASVLLFDAVDRSRELTAFYTEAGVLPARLLPDLVRGPVWSLHAYASPDGQLALFGLLILAALALVVGWRTRLAAVVCWGLLASVHQRNPLLAYSGGDDLLRTLLFWGMFLPLGARFSIDARRVGAEEDPRLLSFASAALLLQIAIVYWSNGFEKLQGPWLEGTALAYALDLSFFRGPLAATLRPHEGLLRFGTWLTPAFELLAPCLAFVPVRTERLRMAAVVLFVGFHLGLLALFDISIFPAVCIAAWTAFLPGGFWRSLEAWRRADRRGGTTVRRERSRPRIRFSRTIDVMAGAFLVYGVGLLGAAYAGLGVPRPLALVSQVLDLHLGWAQFAAVAPVDAWPVVHGTTSSGRVVDPILGGAPLLGRPASIPALFPDFKWRMYYFGLVQRALAHGDHSKLRRLVAHLADYYCRDWNARHVGGEAMVGIRIAVWSEGTASTRVEAPQQRFAHESRCGEAPS
jgi:hypothetical protein